MRRASDETREACRAASTCAASPPVDAPRRAPARSPPRRARRPQARPPMPGRRRPPRSPRRRAPADRDPRVLDERVRPPVEVVRALDEEDRGTLGTVDRPAGPVRPRCAPHPSVRGRPGQFPRPVGSRRLWSPHPSSVRRCVRCVRRPAGVPGTACHAAARHCTRPGPRVPPAMSDAAPDEPVAATSADAVTPARPPRPWPRFPGSATSRLSRRSRRGCARPPRSAARTPVR